MNQFWTVIIGVVVFAASQYFLKLILEPVIAFRQIIADISHSVLLHHSQITNASQGVEGLPEKLKDLSARLRSSVYLIPCYSLFATTKLFGLPPKKNILHACHYLNLLSYGMNAPGDAVVSQATENVESLNRLANLLPIDTDYSL